MAHTSSLFVVAGPVCRTPTSGLLPSSSVSCDWLAQSDGRQGGGRRGLTPGLSLPGLGHPVCCLE
eukprot:15465729-Alexandrium_andersonii.AAC.1